jgi:serine/threonine-protein kinase
MSTFTGIRRSLGKSLLLSMLLLAVLMVPARAAWAQQGSSTSASRAAAEALFEQGRKLLGEKKYDEACEKLEASHKLDPGVGTLLYLGDCYEKAGKLASSWAAFQEAASLGTTRGEMDRVKVAQVRATALMPRLPMVVFVVDQKLPGLEVRRDGALVPEASWGSAVPVDAGPTTIMVSAPGYQRWETTLTVPANLKEPLPVRVPTLSKEGGAVATSEPLTATPAASVPSSEPAPAQEGSTQRTVGLLVGGAGVVALVVSGVLTLVASGKNSDSEKHCLPNAPNQCDSIGVADRDDAKNLANIATVMGVSGGVLLAGGTVVYFTAPKSANHGAAGPAPQGLMINLKGSF